MRLGSQRPQALIVGNTALGITWRKGHWHVPWASVATGKGGPLDPHGARGNCAEMHPRVWPFEVDYVRVEENSPGPTHRQEIGPGTGPPPTRLL